MLLSGNTAPRPPGTKMENKITFWELSIGQCRFWFVFLLFALWLVAFCLCWGAVKCLLGETILKMCSSAINQLPGIDVWVPHL